ncbi:MAG: GAF domain-containing protein [Anaerolineae bacterium]|nr:GAF domain-containing protein [Anaerolineae bacterium]
MSIGEGKLSQFLEISHRLAAGTEVDALCETLADGLMQSGLDRCSIVLGVRYEGMLLIEGRGVAIRDADPTCAGIHLGETHLTKEYPIIEYIVREREPVMVNDIESDWRLAESERAFMTQLGVLSAVVCPMVSRDRVTGYILAEKRAKGGFNDEDLALYRAISSHAASTIEMARLVASMEQEIAARTQQVEQFRGLAENAVDAVCMAALGEHKLIYANPAYYDMHGYSADDAVIGTVDDSFAFYEESQGSTITQLTRLGGLRREHTHVRKDGSTFIGQDTVFAVRDQAGVVVALGSIIRDVTRQKALEQRLREMSERRHWQFEIMTEIAQNIAAAPAMEELFARVVTLVKERLNYYHTHLYLISQAGDMLDMVEGYGEPGRLLKERGHRLPMGKGLVGEAARTSAPVRVDDVTKQANWIANPLLPDTRSELAVPIKIGSEVLGVLDVQSDRLRGFDDDDQALLLGLCGQIAVAIQNARILASVQRLVDERTREVTIFQSLTENASYGVWMSTPEGVIEYANGASHVIFGYDYPAPVGGREMVGLMVEQCLAAHSARRLQTQMPKILSGSSWQGELDGQRKDGSTFNLLTLVFTIANDEGTPIAVAAIHRDITEQKRLEVEQERLNRESIEAQERLIRELSAPLIPITQDILVLPLIGVIDSVRAQQIMESMLQGVEGYDAEVVIIDITGVPVLDTSVANHLIQMTNAAALLGAKTVLVGIMPSVAQTLVELGVDLSSIITRNNLQGGVEYALRLQGLHIASLRKG